MTLDTVQRRKWLKAGNLVALFNDIGWDHLGTSLPVTVGEDTYLLRPVAEKRGVQVYACGPNGNENLPNYATRRKIEREVAKNAAEHLLIFTDSANKTQVWQWVAKEPGKPAQVREVPYHSHQSGAALLQRLERITFTLSDEESLNLIGVTSRLRDAFDRDRVTRRFYDRFKSERTAFQKFIDGIGGEDDQLWYTSVMINRIMFLYFVQSKGFLNGDGRYLQNRLAASEDRYGKNRFYRGFLCSLFFEGLAKRESERDAKIAKDLGKLPYLSGSLFVEHAVEERHHGKIDIPDAAFEKLFAFFDAYHWHLDERPLASGDEINPDVLGYIFEKYINQKQMGAYYTKEDITEYISKNTILPFVLGRVQERCTVAFQGEYSVWRLLAEDPDRYLYPAVKHGMDLPLPPEIEAGVSDVAKRGEWNKLAPEEYALPTEIWREVVARRQRCAEVREKLASGAVASPNDLITYNLDIRQFVQDVIERGEGANLLTAFWETLNGSRDGSIPPLTVLDPTCGSGAFLFAALEVLKPLYEACLGHMEGFVGDADRLNRPQEHPFFRETLAGIAKHPNHDYYVLKKIIVNNLYGVDIMEEAAEICKLRLFLKLAAQVDPDPTGDNLGIEPLPDIDFNIRAGNSLVGFATERQVKAAIFGGDQQRMASDAEEVEWKAFQQALETYDHRFADFLAMQERGDFDSEFASPQKAGLRAALAPLREKADTLLGYQYGTVGKVKFAAWRKSHEPFHWFVEFYRVVRRGGFDVIIGNPPYVSTGKLSYSVNGVKKFPDIYANVLLRTLDLCHKDSRAGMIVPLSLTFSGDFADLRSALSKWGTSWYSSYDNIPAAVFAGVSQRCTIWLGVRSAEKESFVAPMFRWRSEYREYLTSTRTYIEASGFDLVQSGIPKLAAIPHRLVLRKIEGAAAKIDRYIIPGDRTGTFRIGFSQSARNLVSAFIEPPPCLNESISAETTSSKIGFLRMPSNDAASACLAVLAGEVFLWYWLVNGDGFDVTSWIVGNYLKALNSLPDEHFSLLVKLGELIHERRYEALAFKENAGQYVGNFNFRRLQSLTRRADLLFLSGLGVGRCDALGVLDYVQRVLSINIFAGEKSIPAEVKAKFPPRPVDQKQQQRLFAESDGVLTKHYGFTEEELDLITNGDTRYHVEGGTEGEADGDE